jgi:uncharacterized protein (TIGR04255 family)
MKYTNAPIREAIFDIRVNQLENKQFEDFSMLQDKLDSKYINKRKINTFEGVFDIDGNENINTNSRFRGVIFSNKENNKQVQFRIDGFTLNYLAPYSNWEEFKDEAFNLWKIYLDHFHEIKVERIALRYINRIEIPLTFKGFEEYLTSVPTIPNVLPKVYKGFFSQIIVPCNIDDYTAILTTTLETKTSKVIPFILDIDIFKDINNSDWNFNDFDYIRNTKNSIFESSITDKTRELFK